jgi:ADP-heptose:LPS heptosyltransferase
MKKAAHAFSNFLDAAMFLLLRVALPFRRRKRTDGSVLIVFFAHLGDFVLWLDSARAYRQIYPGRKITLMLYRYCDVSALANATGLFDEVLVVDTGWRHRVRSVLRIMRLGFDTVIQPRASRTLQSDLFVLAPRSEERLVPQSDCTMISPFWHRQSDRCYTRVVACGGIGTMELLRNAQFVRWLGAEDFRASLPVLPTFPGEGDFPSGRYFALCPGADGFAKRWPIENFTELANRILEQSPLSCMILGTKAEKELEDRIVSGSRFPERLIPNCGRTSLKELAEAIRDSAFLVSSDSGSAHIGPAVGTPTFVFGSGWDYGRFFPYRTETEEEKSGPLPVNLIDQSSCLGCGQNPSLTRKPECLVNGTMKCIASVTAEEAWNAIQENPGFSRNRF